MRLRDRTLWPVVLRLVVLCLAVLSLAPPGATGPS